MRRALRILAAITVALVALLYAADYLSLRFKFPGRREQFGSVTVRPLYIIHEKNGKVEYQFADPQDQQCVRSLFPHFGYNPCWYVSRHTEQQINI